MKTLAVTLKDRGPAGLAVALIAAAVVCSTWAWATQDGTIGAAGIVSTALFVPLALILDRSSARRACEKTHG